MRHDIGLTKKINIHKENISILQTVTQGSDLTLRLAIVDYYNNDVDISNQEVSLRITRKDNVTIEQVSDMIKTNNALTIKLKNSAIESVGVCKCYLNLKDVNGQMTSAVFYLDVRNNNITDKVVEASDSYETLDRIKSDFKTLEVQINDSENVRKASEINRVAEEDIRKTTETNRINEENTRIINETDRVSEENIRKVQEESRETKEQERQDIFTGNELNRENAFVLGQDEQKRIFENTELDRETRCNDNINYMISDYNNLKFQILDENIILQLQAQIEDLYKKIEVIETGGCGHNKTVLTEAGLITMSEDNKKITTGGILNVLQ